MKTYLQAYFDKLKSFVLHKSQISQLVPADCYRLALEIKAATHKSVSETTLKRVFGFASSVHQPSIYTLNALAEYCDFDSWDTFYSHMEQGKLQTSQQKTWGEISLNATKISLFNIQSNKYKCGIPYHLTVDRENLAGFADHFLRSGATVGILSGPAGYGKTVAMSRWIEKQISDTIMLSSNDVYLFTNSLSLLQGTAYGYHSTRWLAHLLGFETSELLEHFMETHRGAAPGNFYLVIDELHSDLVPERQFFSVMTQFVEMVHHFAQYEWFRIIVTLRDATLQKYESLFRNTVINPQWFSVLSGESGKKWATMPAFSNIELHQLFRNIKGNAEPFHLWKTENKSIIGIPLFFQYFYELHGDQLDVSKLGPSDRFFIVAQYLRKKIYNGVNTLGKQYLMEELASLLRPVTLNIHKKQAYSIIKQYKTAYNDLLYVGLLHESTNGGSIRQQTSIQFQSDNIATYFLATQLYNQYDDVDLLVQTLNQQMLDKTARLDILKWLILFYIETGDLSLLDRFEQLTSVSGSRSTLIAFIADAITKLCARSTSDIKNKLHQALYDSPFLEFVLNEMCIQADNELNLATLLDFNLSDKHDTLLRIKLAIISLLRWDEETLVQQLEKLADKGQGAYADFGINPFTTLSTIYQYFKGADIDPAATLDNNQIALHIKQQKSYGMGQVTDILVYFSIKVGNDREVAHWYPGILDEKMKVQETRNPLDRQFDALIDALCLLECGEADMAMAHYIGHVSYTDTTASHQLLNTFFLLQYALHKGEDIVEPGKRVISVCEAFGFRLLEAYCRLLIIEEIPKNEKKQYINNLKFQFAAFGYTTGLGVLSKNYG